MSEQPTSVMPSPECQCCKSCVLQLGQFGLCITEVGCWHTQNAARHTHVLAKTSHCTDAPVKW